MPPDTSTSLPRSRPHSMASKSDQPALEETTKQELRPKGRNLVLTVDGTSNKFGDNNTNVIELYSRLEASEEQWNYYNSGVGTITKPGTAWKWITQNFDKTVDLAIAWNFEKVIIAAYRWLSERYQQGDRIYLFGFSRGAYQMRVLAAMIKKVGLIQAGNEEQIPLYVTLGFTPNNLKHAERFKETFSRRDVNIHFLGVWDTVSSVGLVGNKILPLTDEYEHITIFRHALALDERRVKFIPECLMRKKFEDVDGKPVDFDELMVPLHVAGKSIPVKRVKEVWFAGSHSDVGGGSLNNDALNLESAPLLWMVNEAAIAGLHLTQSTVEWKIRDLETRMPTRSLHTFWWALEYFPVHRQSRSDRSKTSHWHLHAGKTRAIYPGQKIHASVAFKNRRYQPKAEFFPTRGALRKDSVDSKAKDSTASTSDSKRTVSKISFSGSPDRAAGGAQPPAPLPASDTPVVQSSDVQTEPSDRTRGWSFVHKISSRFRLSQTPTTKSGPNWDHLVAEGPSGTFRKAKNWTSLLEMDLFDLQDASRIFALLFGESLSSSNTLHVLNRLGFLASLDNGQGADAVWLCQEDQQDGRSNALKRLLGGQDRVFLGTVKLLARLATALTTTADQRIVTNILIEYKWNSAIAKGHTEMTSGGVVDRLVELLNAGTSVSGEAANTIVDIAPIKELRQGLENLHVTDALVRMLSGVNATAAANALVALSRHDTWFQTILKSMGDRRTHILSFNARLQPPKDGGEYETRDAAATIIAGLADRLPQFQSTAKVGQSLGASSSQTVRTVDEQTISLLKNMLDVDGPVSDSAANAFRELSKDAWCRNLILKEAATDLVGMLRKDNSGPALNAVAELIKTQKGVTSKTESLILAIANTLKDSSRGSAAIILTELISEPKAAIVILESKASIHLLESLNKRDPQNPFNTEESKEYGSLMTCLAAIVGTHTRLTLKAKEADNPPPTISLVLTKSGAEVLFKLILEKSLECHAVADVFVALAEHDHAIAGAKSNREVISSVIENGLDEFTTRLRDMLDKIKGGEKGDKAKLLLLASNVASMIMTLSVLRLAGIFMTLLGLYYADILLRRSTDAKLLLETLEELHKLWMDEFKARTDDKKATKTQKVEENTSARVENDEGQKGQGKEKELEKVPKPERGQENEQELFDPDLYGEQADIVAHAIAKALRQSSIQENSPAKPVAVRQNIDKAEDLVGLLVKRLGSQYQRGTWRAIQQLATVGNPPILSRSDDSCRQAVYDNFDLVPTLVWLSRHGSNRQAAFASKCLIDLENLGIGPRHEHSGGKIRKLCRELLVPETLVVERD
ncbi:hypothetical protein HWV62_41104 [Athelia sp. TMB]|nr:hypothetical protein HWV62_41104 [Athelia sp. TMB]